MTLTLRYFSKDKALIQILDCHIDTLTLSLLRNVFKFVKGQITKDMNPLISKICKFCVCVCYKQKEIKFHYWCTVIFLKFTTQWPGAGDRHSALPAVQILQFKQSVLRAV